LNISWLYPRVVKGIPMLMKHEEIPSGKLRNVAMENPNY
jgi:hypothetical protein